MCEEDLGLSVKHLCNLGEVGESSFLAPHSHHLVKETFSCVVQCVIGQLHAGLQARYVDISKQCLPKIFQTKFTLSEIRHSPHIISIPENETKLT